VDAYVSGGNLNIYYDTTGNVAVGFEAMYNPNTGADKNTCVGWQAGYGLTTGANNVLLGQTAGDALTTGSSNIVIGSGQEADSATASNQINVGGVYFHDRLLYTERADPSAPSSNQAVVYARDNGAGKTQLCVRFATGAIQVLATEP
jgi:hypothetical protein